jgi:hypothetical protein
MDNLKCEVCGCDISDEEIAEEDLNDYRCSICGKLLCPYCIGFISDCNTNNIFCMECTDAVRNDETHPCHECVLENDRQFNNDISDKGD